MIRDLLTAESNRARWSTIKCEEIAKATPFLNRVTLAGGLDVEIVGTRSAGDHIDVLVRAWQGGHQIGFGRDGSVDIERFVIANPPIYVRDPLGTYVRSYVNDEGQTVSLRYREDSREALLTVISRAIAVKRERFLGSRIVSGRVGRSTLIAYPNEGSGVAPMDANLARHGVDESFSTIRNGAGTQIVNATASTVGVDSRAPATSNNFSRNDKGVFGFTTSIIGYGTIISASLTLDDAASSVLTELGDPQLGIVSFTPANAANFAASDYATSNFGTTDLCTRVNMASWSLSNPNVFALNAAGLAAINKTGMTHVALLSGWDIDNAFGGAWVVGRSRINPTQADDAGTVNDPLLTVEYTPFSRARGLAPLASAFEDDGRFNEVDIRNWYRRMLPT